jgi:hypothetical protein
MDVHLSVLLAQVPASRMQVLCSHNSRDGPDLQDRFLRGYPNVLLVDLSTGTHSIFRIEVHFTYHFACMALV